METTETPRQRLARLMDERRAEMRFTWDEVAEQAGVTREGLRRMRKGTGHIRSLTKRGIEHALGWGTGSVEAVLAGGQPTLRAPQEKEDPRIEAIERSQVFTRAEKDHLIEHIRSFPPYQTPNQGRDVG